MLLATDAELLATEDLLLLNGALLLATLFDEDEAEEAGATELLTEDEETGCELLLELLDDEITLTEEAVAPLAVALLTLLPLAASDDERLLLEVATLSTSSTIMMRPPASTVGRMTPRTCTLRPM